MRIETTLRLYKKLIKKSINVEMISIKQLEFYCLPTMIQQAFSFKKFTVSQHAFKK